jgi:hypothetical protein
VRAQAIPFTTPFWYFHYDPNRENQPYASMTLNLKPACPEKCRLCAGAKTGRVNNGLQGTLGTDFVFRRILDQHLETRTQLESVAVVTGCFDHFDAMANHLREVRETIQTYAQPKEWRVLEHNVVTPEQFERVVGQLGYDVFITLECFDPEKRKIALNGNQGRKGRETRQFIEMMETYADYLEKRAEKGRDLVRVTYLAGIDPLSTTEELFAQMARINDKHQHARVVPWLSVFTPYAASMAVIQNREFSLQYLIDIQDLTRRYFGSEVAELQTGSTAEGFARGLF